MKAAYLTIDDSPSPDMQSKVDYLHREAIPAVFFCRGDFLEERPAAALDAIRKGFIIANHSYSHPHFSDFVDRNSKNRVLFNILKISLYFVCKGGL